MLKLIQEVRALNLIEFLNTKAKAFVVFLFSMVAVGLFILTTAFATAVCSKWYGLIVGVALMISAIPFHCAGKKKRVGYLISFLLNSVANGFSVSAYYLTRGISLNFYEMLFAAIPAAGILLLVYLMLQTFNKTKKVTVTIAAVIDILLIVASAVMWAVRGGLLFSFAFFCAIVALFYICVFGVTINHDERSVLRDISFGGYGALVILTIVVIVVITGGEALDGIDFGADSDGVKKNRKRKTGRMKSW